MHGVTKKHEKTSRGHCHAGVMVAPATSMSGMVADA
jgi:hypothetical protein